MEDAALAKPNLGIIVPCFNEEEVLRETNERLVALLDLMSDEGLISRRSAIFYVDDGSRDETWNIIEKFAAVHPGVSGIKLSRNCGHQNALICGLMTAPGDMLISIDADLQDDLGVIPDMVRRYDDGFDIVYGVRKRRDVDSLFKRFTAEIYYKLMAAMNADVVFNHADYRLLSRRALEALSEYREVNLFLRGLVPLLGYRSAIVEYDRGERFAGESKYPVRKIFAFAWQGVTSFTTTPLRMITALGFLVSFVSVGLAAWALAASLIMNKALPGWASIVVPMYFLGGIQLLSIGVIGEYIAKIYMESKSRPRFHIDKLEGRAFETGKRSAACLVDAQKTAGE